MADTGPDYFAVLGVPRTWHLDHNLLAARHLALSRELHPDRFAQATPRERILSLERTTAVNDAYRTLRDPIRRAEYILRQHGIGHADQDIARGLKAAATDPEFLAEIMEIRERMMDAGLEGGRGRDAPEAQSIRAAAETNIAALDQAIAEHFRTFESLADREGDEARQVLLEVDGYLARRRYYVNIVQEIDGEEIPAGHGRL
jgi:molecular chaperone HscB